MTTLSTVDPEIFNFINLETKRQEEGIELIASENYCSKAVMEAQGSTLTNKYAEGYPGKRYYDGCEFVDEVENLAIERLKKLFNVPFANVQPHSGSTANQVVFVSFLNPGDTYLGMNLSEGGHLTHGSPVNFSGKLFNPIHYGLGDDERINFNEVEDLAKKHKPKMIIAGASAYSREIDFKTFSEIAKRNNALLMVDMAHIAGLVATGLHQSPVGYADIITSTTHKTLRGPRGGFVLSTDEEIAKKINSTVFPGMQGGPLEHVIAAKAVAFHEALQPSFKTYQNQVIKNAKTLEKVLLDNGIDLVSGGTDNHLVLVKTDSVSMSGKKASTLLQEAHITCNKNMVPKDSRSPFITSGIRLGTPAITTRGFKEEEIKILGKMIVDILKNPEDEKVKASVIAGIKDLCAKFPVYKG